jgi:hypothetical protein
MRDGNQEAFSSKRLSTELVKRVWRIEMIVDEMACSSLNKHYFPLEQRSSSRRELISILQA